MARRGRPSIEVRASEQERNHLERCVRASTSSQRDALRANIILACVDGGSAEEIAQRVNVHVGTVERWRSRFLRRGLEGLKDRPRAGHKPKYGLLERIQITSLACDPVNTANGKTTRTIENIRQETISRGIVESIGWTTIQRMLMRADIKAHKVQGWLHSPDPLFKEKTTEICELYLNQPKDSVVLSIDEKTGMQALERKYPDRPAAPGRMRRREFEYKRHGTQSLFCAFDVHTGKIIEQCGDTRTAQDLIDFMDEVAACHPNGTVHVVWDNLNTHHNGPGQRWECFNQRHGNRFVFHYTPIHASWVNQVELFFSILERQCLRHGSFESKERLRSCVLAFIENWNRESAHPFCWKFKGYPLQIGNPRQNE
jgi:transposase